VQEALDWWRADPSWSTPTSSLSGGGAIERFERTFSTLHADRPSLMVPSATYGLRLALKGIGVGPGDEVVLSVVDWPSSYQAVVSLGALPVPVAVTAATLTIDPVASAGAITRRTKAVIACHLHGVVADVPALRAAVGDLPIVEDCAGALGATLRGQLAGALGDIAIFSLGPGKQISAGEGGVLLARDQATYERARELMAHPLRLALNGVPPRDHLDALPMRVHPIAAILALFELSQWDAGNARKANLATSQALADHSDVDRVLGSGDRANASTFVPLTVRNPASSLGSWSGARVLPTPDPVLADASRRMLYQVRVVGVAASR
jgi:dTDP-4-amino-4,6-dideoxygalactose transaminase